MPDKNEQTQQEREKAPRVPGPFTVRIEYDPRGGIEAHYPDERTPEAIFAIRAAEQIIFNRILGPSRQNRHGLVMVPASGMPRE